MANPSVDDLRIQVLRVAGDNDGLWEFAKILSPELKSRDAYERLRNVFEELIDEGMITVEDDYARLSNENAKAILAVEENWTLPWEPGGAWHTKGDAYSLSLTPAGQAALDDFFSR